MNNENLKPFSERTEKEQREIRSKGGKASAEARRKRKLLKEYFNIWLETEVGKDKSGKPINAAEAMTKKQVDKALKGDTKAFLVIRDTVGEKPEEKIQVSDISTETQEMIEEQIKKARTKNNENDNS